MGRVKSELMTDGPDDELVPNQFRRLWTTSATVIYH